MSCLPYCSLPPWASWSGNNWNTGCSHLRTHTLRQHLPYCRMACLTIAQSLHGSLPSEGFPGGESSMSSIDARRHPVHVARQILPHDTCKWSWSRLCLARQASGLGRLKHHATEVLGCAEEGSRWGHHGALASLRCWAQLAFEGRMVGSGQSPAHVCQCFWAAL